MSEAEIIPIPSAAKMRAAYFEEHGGPSKILYGYRPRPVPGPHEVLIQVRACALNHIDLWTLLGLPGVRIPLPHIGGADIAGIVVDSGRRVRHMKPGRRVLLAPGLSCGRCAHCRRHEDSLCDHYKILGCHTPGGFAEYVKVPAASVIPVSSKLSLEEWAAVPLVFLTAWHMLITRARLRKGETVLIQAAGSGVGSAAVQVARLAGARVLTTVGSDDKIRRARALGADEVIAYRKKDFTAEVLRLTRGRGADVVLDHIGGDTLAKSTACLAKKGRLVTCGVTSGPMAALDVRLLFLRELNLQGCYMGSLQELRRVVRLVEKKKLRPVVDRVFPLRELRAALERMQSREHFGKIVVAP